EGLYPGDYLKPVGGELAAEHGGKLAAMKEFEWLPIVRACRHVPRQRSEEHTSELQSLTNLVCRLLLEKKKTKRRSLSRHSRTSTDRRDVQPLSARVPRTAPM